MGEDDLAKRLFRLIERAKVGDAIANEDLFQWITDYLTLSVRVEIGSTYQQLWDAGDTIQEACVAFLISLDRFEFRGLEELKGYLCRICKNLVRQKRGELGAEKRDVRRDRPLGDVPSERGPVWAVTHRETWRQIEDALNELPLDQSTLYMMVRVDDMSIAEAGRALSLTYTTARRLYCRAQAHVARRLGNDGPILD